MGLKVNLVHTTGTATATSAEALAKSNKLRYFMIMNKDAANILYVTFGEDATKANAIPLALGEKFVLGEQELYTSVNVIADIALTADYLIVTG